MLKRKLSVTVLYCVCTAMLSTAIAYGSEPVVRDTTLIKPVTPNYVRNAPAVTLQPVVKSYVNDYLKKNNESFEKLKRSKGYYFKTIDQVFIAHDLPVELKYLAVIESRLTTNAVSRVGAVGMWQFMPATARSVGLKVGKKIDERKHAYKSTVAAAKYLERLYGMFDDWLLVIAAYNSGPGHVFNAIKKSGSRSFWKLQYFLPQETRLHVKKFIATHHYFEGTGSLVTLTKAERLKHLSTLEEYYATIVTDTPEELPEIPKSYFNWVAVSNDEDQPLIIAKR